MKDKKLVTTEAIIKYLKTGVLELWHDENGDPHATINGKNNHPENYSLQTAIFERKISRAVYKGRGKKPISESQLKEVINQLSAEAEFDGLQYSTFLRFAYYPDTNSIYIDLCNERWEAVEIDKDGYRVVSEVPVKFLRTKGMAPLPQPSPTEDVDQGGLCLLKDFLNLCNDGDRSFALVLGFILGAYNPAEIYPILILTGEQGSGKSTFAHRLGQLIDPNTVSTRAAPKSEEDLFISASNRFLLNFDNMSSIDPWLSDAVCRIATKGGFQKRKLYSDNKEILFYLSRPQIFNGIDNLAERNDLADRAIFLTLPSIPPEKRKAASQLERDFVIYRPKILGAIYMAISAALRNKDNVTLKEKPRMADFAIWMVAAEEALPIRKGLFMEAYLDNALEAARQNVENDPLGFALVDFMKDRVAWTGSMTDLRDKLSPPITIRPTGLPKTAKSLQAHLKRLTPALRRQGIEVSIGKRDTVTRRTLYTITNTNFSEDESTKEDE